MDENLKTGLVIGVPLAIGITVLVASIVRAEPVAPYQPPVNGQPPPSCAGIEYMEVTMVSSGVVRLSFYDQVMQSNYSSQFATPAQNPQFNVVMQLDHSLSLGRITQNQYQCAQAQLASLGI